MNLKHALIGGMLLGFPLVLFGVYQHALAAVMMTCIGTFMASAAILVAEKWFGMEVSRATRQILERVRYASGLMVVLCVVIIWIK